MEVALSAREARGAQPPLDRETVKTSADVSFTALCKMLANLKDQAPSLGSAKHVRPGRKKRGWLKRFREHFLPAKPSAELLYDIYRLIMPKMDKERQVYGLKEPTLAELIAQSLGATKGQEKHAQLLGWRKSGSGNFADNVQQVFNSLALPTPKDFCTVREVNEMLDKLADVKQRSGAVKPRDYQAKIMTSMLLRMDGQEVAWLCRIILKLEMKIGMQEKALLDELHVDANDVFNTCCDLRKTFEVVAPCYPGERVKRQDVLPGQMVRPQGSNRIQSLARLQSMLRSKEYIAELKFDGERLQLHRDGDKFNLFSRKMIDWGPRGYSVFDIVAKQQIRAQSCILDGELVIWHTGLKQFVEFGNNKTVMFHVRKAWEDAGKHWELTDDEDEHKGGKVESEMSQLRVWYMAFDILYDDKEGSVINRPLRERHELLRRAVRALPDDQPIEMTPPGAKEPVFGAIKLLLPGSPWSQPVRANDPKHLQELMQHAVDNNEEGVVCKDLDSHWQKGDKSSAWIKFKPDYLPTEDLDVLIIGCYNGTGKNGGKLSQFLLGVAEKPRGGGDPCVFQSFCKVGSGMTQADLLFLQEHFASRLLPGGARGTQPPCYKVTGSPMETPDYWVKDPRESVVLTVKGDVRVITTSTFFTKFSLRFPRVTAVAKEKHWADVFSDVALDEQMWALGRLQGGGSNGGPGQPASEVKPRPTAPRRARGVASGLAAASTDDVVRVSDIFQGESILVLDPLTDKNATCKLIAAQGGEWKLRWSRDVTRVVTKTFSPGMSTKADIAAGLVKYPAQNDGNIALSDVLHERWLDDCVAAGHLLPPAPRHRLLFVGSSDANKLRDLDRFGDSYTEPVNVDDVKALLKQASGAAKHAAAQAEAVAALCGKAGSAVATIPKSLAADIADKVASELQAVDVAAMLAAEHKLSDTPYGCMRSLHITLLLLPPHRASAYARQADAVAAAADDAVRPYAYQRLMRGIQLYGGVASAELSEETTHLVALPHAGWASLAPGALLLQRPPPTLADVEAALAERSPAQARLLRRRVQPQADSRDSSAGHLWVLSREWLDDRIACAAAGAAAHEDHAAPARMPRFMLDFVLTEGAAAPRAKRPAGGDSPRRVAPRLDDPMDT